MKQFCAVVLACLLASLPLYAQNKIEGVGKFKIGKTGISITDEIAKEGGDTIHVIDEYLNMDTEKFSIAEIVVNKTYPDRSPEQAIFCPGVRLFQVSAYQIAGMEIKNLWLTFKSDVLIEVRFDNSVEVDEALRLKYGPPAIKTEKKPIDCVYLRNGNKLQREEVRFTSTWSNGKILTTQITHKFYDKNCIEEIIAYVKIRDSQQLGAIVQCDQASRAKSQIKKQESAKKALSDF